MKIRDLIEQLQKFDLDDEVIVPRDDDYPANLAGVLNVVPGFEYAEQLGEEIIELEQLDLDKTVVIQLEVS